MKRSVAETTKDWIANIDRSRAGVAAALERLANEANDPTSREAFRRGAEAVRNEPPPPASCKNRGRKPINDDAALLEMARHNAQRRARGEKDNDREAATFVARRLVGHSSTSVVERLRKKIRKSRSAATGVKAGV